ncbi:MAG: right-handed parallel beta-helix repeat-containing protein [Alphaproteobacteria bacterium]|nr:right-handed parallel beta-helix repeat-containing protein [Alphaproteobacteria bacterium]
MVQVPRRKVLVGAGLALLPIYASGAYANPFDAFNIRNFGARGDGNALDTKAIQRAIDAAAASGGGTVYLPAGRYLSFSIRLKSRITLLFASGATLIAADPAKHSGHYDLPEPNLWDAYEDFGHSHWHNSLIWGEDLEDVAIIGPGLIDGEGLTRFSPDAPWSVGAGRDLPSTQTLKAQIAKNVADVKSMNGLGNKAIALKNTRNVTMRDFSIFRGGHFGILVTGVDNLTMDNLKIDTNRDGIDLDVVRNAHLSNLSVNSPTDDAIVLKSSLALGEVRPIENVTITNCNVSGYDVGSMLDGTYRKSQLKNITPHLTSGRIKLGTESNGGYHNIAISNCVFDCCNGLAIESVDGGVLEDVTVNNIVMRDTTAAPIFIRLGDRRRAPAGTPIAALRRVTINDIDAYCLDKRYCASITGLPDAPVEDVTLSGIRLIYPGGGTASDAARLLPESAEAYPDPDMFGVMPAWGLYMRHIRGVILRDVELSTLAADARPPAVTDDVSGLRAEDLLAAKSGTPLQAVKL